MKYLKQKISRDMNPDQHSFEAVAIYNKEASRLYAELLLCVCWHTEDI